MKTPKLKNLYEIPALPLQEEAVEIWAQGKDWRVERIVSSGQISPAGFWYDQEEDEWVCLLQGKAILAYEDGGEIPLQTGDWLAIPRHQRHRVAYTSSQPPAIWLCFFSAPEEEEQGKRNGKE